MYSFMFIHTLRKKIKLFALAVLHSNEQFARHGGKEMQRVGMLCSVDIMS
jgi:hypothetical protein